MTLNDGNPEKPPEKPPARNPEVEAPIISGGNDTEDGEPPAPVIIEQIGETDQRPQRGTGGIIGFRGRRVTLNDRRVQLTWGLIALTGILSIGTIVLLMVLPETRVAVLREFMPIIYTPIITLLGTSFAWFFATADRNDQQQ